MKSLWLVASMVLLYSVYTAWNTKHSAKPSTQPLQSPVSTMPPAQPANLRHYPINTNQPGPRTNVVRFAYPANVTNCTVFYLQQSHDRRQWTTIETNPPSDVWVFPTSTPTFYRVVGR